MHFSEKDQELFIREISTIYNDENVIEQKVNELNRAMDYLLNKQEIPELYIYSINFITREIGFFVPQTGFKVTYLISKDYSQQIRIFNLEVLLRKIGETFYYLKENEIMNKKKLLEAAKKFFIHKSCKTELYIHKETDTVLEIGIFVEDTGLKITFLTKYHPVYNI